MAVLRGLQGGPQRPRPSSGQDRPPPRSASYTRSPCWAKRASSVLGPCGPTNAWRGISAGVSMPCGAELVRRWLCMTAWRSVGPPSRARPPSGPEPTDPRVTSRTRGPCRAKRGTTEPLPSSIEYQRSPHEAATSGADGGCARRTRQPAMAGEMILPPAAQPPAHEIGDHGDFGS
jgi:hypothetical protein